jgi:hypothetical protein
VFLSSGEDLWTLSRKAKAAYEAEEYEQALEYYTRAQNRAPENEKIRYNTALTYVRLGEYKKAAALLEDHTFLDGEDALRRNVLFSRGVALDRMGDTIREQLTQSQSDEYTVDDVKKAYEGALTSYAEALQFARDSTEILTNMEITARKLRNLPEPPESQNDSDGGEESEDNTDDNSDDASNNQDENDQDEDDQDEDDQDESDQDESDQDENDQDENDQNENDQDENEQDENEQDEEEQDEEELEREEARRIIDQYSDDLLHVNKPGDTLDAQDSFDGKDW